MTALLVTWAFAAAFFAAWEWGAYLRRRFLVAPFDEHQGQAVVIVGLEQRLLAGEAADGELRTEITRLKAELVGRKSDQALADFLTERHAFGIRELLNKPPMDQSGMAEWRTMASEFTDGVLAKMREHNCTAQDLHAVEYIGVFTHLPLHRDFEIAKDLSMLVERLNRIGGVSTKYAERYSS